jgi:ribosomal-protein-alanine N-acetyltransferase
VPSTQELARDANGVWLLLECGQLRGYAALFPVPGLSHIFELHGEVLPDACAGGGAGDLLDTVVQESDVGSVRQISYAVDDLQDEDAIFLQAYGFRLEHEEWRMQCALPPLQPLPTLPPGYQVGSLPQGRRVEAFLQLYDASFSPRAWYQPYSRGEVASEWARGHELLFLFYEQQPVGFAWLRQYGEDGEIEPMGLLPAFQGQGLGRVLLLSALWRFAECGLRRATLGLWRQNEAALHLYQNAGFRQISRRYYLALSPSTQLPS